jgi:protein-disulfide isomerase
MAPATGDPRGEAREEDAAIPVALDDPTWGQRAAPVTLVVFAELECPFCRRLAPTLRELEQKYGPQALRVVWKSHPMPFHPNARPAAEAAQAVFMLGGSDAFFTFCDNAFASQDRLTRERFVAWGRAAGVDPAKLGRMLDAHVGADKVERDTDLAAKLGAEGTPSVFINGVAILGAQPFEKFASVIDAEMGKAKARIASGTRPDQVYAEAAKANFIQPPQWSSKAPSPPPDETTVWKVPVGDGPARGGPSPLVTIVEFADFQCPYSKRVQETLQRVLSVYGDKVRLVWRDAPLWFHKRAWPAATLAREARAEKGSAAFWTVHDALFASQTNLEDVDLAVIARTAGLDPDKVASAVAHDRYKTAIQLDASVGDDFGVTGTPQLFVNGRRLVGAQTFEKVQTTIDQEMERARGLMAKGVPAGALYDALIKDGKPPPPLVTKLVAAASPGAPSRGNASAPVVIQEFANFECPFSRRAEDTLAEVLKSYGPKVRLVWRDMPLAMYTHSPIAAEAAREAMRQQGDAGFWRMHDKLFAAQPTSGALDRAALDGYAKDLGLDMAAWSNALDKRTHRPEVDRDVEAARDAQIGGTPGFVIGGYYLSGAQPLLKFQKVIDRVLAQGPAKPPVAAVK